MRHPRLLYFDNDFTSSKHLLLVDDICKIRWSEFYWVNFSRICGGKGGIIMETTSGDYGYRPLSIRNSFGLCLEENSNNGRSAFSNVPVIALPLCSFDNRITQLSIRSFVVASYFVNRSVESLFWDRDFKGGVFFLSLENS